MIRTTASIRVVAIAALLASGEIGHPAVREFDQSAGLAEVFVGDDGFGVYEGERQPLDLVVLKLRWRTRALDLEARRHRFVARLLPVEKTMSPEVAERVQAAMNRLVDELHVMGVLQVRYL